MNPELNGHPYLPKDPPFEARIRHFHDAMIGRMVYHRKAENHNTRICIEYLLDIYENIFEEILKEDDDGER